MRTASQPLPTAVAAVAAPGHHCVLSIPFPLAAVSLVPQATLLVFRSCVDSSSLLSSLVPVCVHDLWVSTGGLPRSSEWPDAKRGHCAIGLPPGHSDFH